MPPGKDEVWVHFRKSKEKYIDTANGKPKTRQNVTCLFCSDEFVLRNVEQLHTHLACPTEGIGKQCGCVAVKVKAPAIQAKYATALAEREAARKQKNRKRDQEAAIQRTVDGQAKAKKLQSS